MEDVSDLASGDVSVGTDRTTAYYNKPLLLAKHILRSEGRTIKAGASYAKTFLIRTPLMVEEGVRKILKDALSPRFRVKNEAGKKYVVGAPLTLNPDLVFDEGLATGDVKYKLNSGAWNRSDLYQAIAFATGFKTRHGLVVGFRTDPGVSALPALTVGDVQLHYVAWDASGSSSADTAAEQLCGQVRAWLVGIADGVGRPAA